MYDNLVLKNIVENSDILRTKCSDVKNIDDNIIAILDNMLDLMYKSGGIGLAANQVGITLKLVVIDLQQNDKKSPIFLINPEIIEHSNNIVKYKEGCLSVPGVEHNVDIERYEKVKVKYLDKNSKENIIEADGLLAVCLQHEIDHLHGKVYLDHMSKLKRDLAINKVKKFLKMQNK